ncbi:Transposon Ty3-G Gag-Pol polyprotein [Gossypium australe]|uniref:Transposon Ty3-G Gag-Pol polyprotein n=1 Tax=Gossypium australe TaxID=47621 RepID=A0A5B6W867_9ROSI|nr:Transposon Ty3-G Gag-Pol polyprotein [Gossypium australe]
MFHTYERAYKINDAMNSYMWPNEIFMYQSKPQTVKVVKEENNDDHIIKPTRAEPHYESQSEEASYLNNRGRDPYSSTYNPGWKDHPNFKWGGNQQSVNQAQSRQNPPYESPPW